jgi:hypothetical protein
MFSIAYHTSGMIASFMKASIPRIYSGIKYKEIDKIKLWRGI